MHRKSFDCLAAIVTRESEWDSNMMNEKQNVYIHKSRRFAKMKTYNSERKCTKSTQSNEKDTHERGKMLVLLDDFSCCCVAGAARMVVRFSYFAMLSACYFC